MSPEAIVKSTLFRGVFPHQMAWLLDNPLRSLLISPAVLVDRLPLTDSSRVLEVGPGSGFFSRELASRIPHGWLDLFDLQPEMLEKAKRKMQQAGLTNVGYTVGNAGRAFPFPAEAFDVALFVSVLGEVTNQLDCLRSTWTVLRTGGALVCHESVPDPDRIEFNRLVDLVAPAGFELRQRWGGRWRYTAQFVKL